MRFTASPADLAAKDSVDLMARCWFSLSPGRTQPIEHEFVDARTGQTESIRITGSGEHGIATIHDQDLLIFAISQWIDAKRHGLEVSRRIHFTPYQFFSWINREPGGGQYQRLRECLHRLKMTSIQTTIRSAPGKRARNRTRQFSWISEWEIAEENGEIRGIEVVLAEWLFESIQDFHVLTLDKRYFDIPGSVERWLYLYARKSTGGPNGIWRESFKSLHRKSASQQEYKHYASTLRKLVKKNALPGFRLEQVSSAQGRAMLLMERLEKRAAPGPDASQAKEVQLALIERSPLEDAWENVLEIMRRHLGADPVRSWLERLRITSPEEGVILCRAPSKFMAEWIDTHYRRRLESAWGSVGHPFREIRIEAAGTAKKTGIPAEKTT